MFERLVDLDQGLSAALYGSWARLNIPEALTLGLAVYLIYLIPLLLVWLWFKKGSQTRAVLAGLAGLLGWLGVGNLISVLYFRHRPFDRTDIKVVELLFHRPDKSFPSDHAIVSFAIAFVLLFEREYRLALVFFLIGLVNGLARVGAGLHFVGDLIGAVPAALVASLIVWLLRRPIKKEIVLPMARLSERLGLGRPL